ncbi:MAG: HisA/HisF-related TIM barrel protein [Planctomycetota bacterium]|nr:HisA/HisF-related TIM barrel protein [Planctomycetota bacterium]
MPIQVLPVLDILDHVVVRGVAGQRDDYRPIESLICESAVPLDVAMAIRERFGLNEFYVADLDSIVHARLNAKSIQSLTEHGFRLLVDAGVRETRLASELMRLQIQSVIVGLESIPNPQLLSELAADIDPSRIIFSLDLQQGRPLGDLAAWSDPTPLGIANEAIQTGVTQLIVLDLAAVGTSKGPMVLELCRELRAKHPEIRIISGGGISRVADIAAFEDAGADAVLVATSLHNGQLTAADINTGSNGC